MIIRSRLCWSLPHKCALLTPKLRSPRGKPLNIIRTARVCRTYVRAFPTEGFELVSQKDAFEEERLPGYQADRFYPVQLCDVFNTRYRVLAKLGFGTSSTIWLCRDLETDTYLTLKICTAIEDGSTRSVGNELEVSQYLESVQTEHVGKSVVRLPVDSFQLSGPHGTHQCLLFAPLGISFSKLRSRFPNRSLPQPLVRQSLQGILVALDFLHQADIVHTDLSPNNILLGLTDSSVLVNIEDEELKRPTRRKVLTERIIHLSHAMPITGGLPVICDFGMARIGLAHHGDVMPGQYRAPEVILGMEWNSKIDIWALGAMIWDMTHGGCLFYAAKDRLLNDEQHLAEMVSLMGPPPRKFLERSENCAKYWDAKGNWIASTPVPEQSFELRERWAEGEDRKIFLQLLRKIFCWLPEERPSAQELFKDEFIFQDRL